MAKTWGEFILESHKSKINLNSATPKLCNSCHKHNKCSYYNYDKTSLNGDKNPSTSDLSRGLQKLEEDVIPIAKSDLVQSLLELSEISSINNPKKEGCKRVKFSYLLQILEKLLSFLNNFNVNYLPSFLIVVYSINSRVFTLDCHSQHEVDSTSAEALPLDFPSSLNNYDFLTVSLATDISIRPQSNRDLILNLKLNLTLPVDLVTATIPGLVMLASIHITDHISVKFLQISNFTKSTINLSKGQLLCSLYFWHKKRIILILNKEVFNPQHVPNPSDDLPTSPFILSTLIIKSLNEGGFFPFADEDIYQNGRKMVEIHNLSQKMGQTKNKSDFLDLDSDPENLTRLVDPENTREGIYSSENGNEEENSFNRDEYISLPARKWELKNNSLANSTLQLALVTNHINSSHMLNLQKLELPQIFMDLKANKRSRYCIRDKLLFYNHYLPSHLETSGKPSTKECKLVLPSSVAIGILNYSHSSLNLHSVRNGLTVFLETKFKIHNFPSLVKQAKKGCGICNLFKGRKSNSMIGYSKHQKPCQPGEEYQIDLCFFPQFKNGKLTNQYPVLMCDVATNYLICRPLLNYTQATLVNKIQEVFQAIPPPKRIVSDSGPEFGNFFPNVYQTLEFSMLKAF